MLPYFYWYYNYGEWAKLDSNISTAKQYTVYVYYYTGTGTKTLDLTLDNGTKVQYTASQSVKEIKEISTSTGEFSGNNYSISEKSSDTKWELDNTKVTMAEYASKLWDHINQLNLILSGCGVSFVPENGDNSSYRMFTSSSDKVITDSSHSEYNGGEYKGYIFIFNPYTTTGINGAMVGYPDNLSTSMKQFKLFATLFKHSTLDGKESDYGSAGKFYSGEFYNIRMVMLHELCHCLGVGHSYDLNGYATLPVSGTKTWEGSALKTYFNLFNMNRRYMPIYKGFIHKGYIQEDTVNTLFLLYGASCQTTVTGNISGSNTVLNARFKDGLGVAYLLDSVKVEFMYQSPIDRNGTFKFKLAVLPPSSIDYYVVITTAEFNTHFIRSSKKDYGNQQINRPIKRNTDNTFNYTLDDETSDGYDLKEYGTYWHAKKKITLSAGDVSVSIDPSEGSEDGLGFSSESLADAAKIPANIDYGGHGNFSVVCIDSKYWLCTKTHKSKSGDNGNKPKIGKKWKKYWMRCPSKYEGMSEKWKNETKYYGYNSESTETESNKHLLCKLH